MIKIDDMEKIRKLVSIIIPAMNEENNIDYLLDDIRAVIKNMDDYEFEIIVVDDHSKDNTRLVAQSKNVKVINNLRKPGKGHALITGFENAHGEYFIMMDADCSHQAKDIPNFIASLKDDVGLVIGSRLYGGSEEYTRLRAMGNIILTLMFGIFHHRYLSDALNGFKGFKSEIFTKYKYTSRDFEIEIELLVNTLRSGMRIIEIPSHEKPRRSGKVKSSIIKHGIKFLNRILKEWLKDKINKTVLLNK